MFKFILAVLVWIALELSSTTPVAREHEWWVQRVEQIQSVVDKTGRDAHIIFVGDSITQGWEGAGAKVWEEQLAPLGAINLGIGGDRTEHVLWRLEHGNIDGLSPAFAVVMIGTNNFGQANPDDESEVLAGVVAVVEKLRTMLPRVKVILLDIFPRGEEFNAMRGSILQVNQALQATFEGDSNVTFLPIGHQFIEDDGSINKQIMPDYLHLSEDGYQRWAQAITPMLTKKKRREPSQKLKPTIDTSRSGPWDHDVLVYSVDTKGNQQQLSTFERAGVPTIGVMKDGRLIAAHQWFPEDDEDNFDKIAVLFSGDNGQTWTKPVAMEFEGLDPEARYPFDPTLVVLEDGRVRLYFTYMIGSRQFNEATPGIASAISQDGIHYVKEDGWRLQVEDEPVIDCSVCLFKNRWHLVSPFQSNNESKAYHAVSKDGLEFKRERDIEIDESFKWLGCMQVMDGKLTFFGSRQHGAPPPTSGRGIPVLTSTNGTRWRSAESLQVMGADPGVVELEDGTKVVLVTGMAREGTVSHENMQQQRKNRKPNPNRDGNRPQPRGR